MKIMMEGWNIPYSFSYVLLTVHVKYACLQEMSKLTLRGKRRRGSAGQRGQVNVTEECEAVIREPNSRL